MRTYKTENHREALIALRHLLRQAEKASLIGLNLCVAIREDGRTSYKPLSVGLAERNPFLAITAATQFEWYLMDKYFFPGLIKSKKALDKKGTEQYPGSHSVNAKNTAVAIKKLLKLAETCEIEGMIYIFYTPEGRPVAGKIGEAKKNEFFSLALVNKLLFSLTRTYWPGFMTITESEV